MESKKRTPKAVRVPVYVEHDSHGVYTVSCIAEHFPHILFSLREWLRSNAKKIAPARRRKKKR